MDDSWKLRAACRGMDVSLFFAVRGETGRGKQACEHAMSVCGGCPVRAECLEENLDEHFGVFGGTSERARRRIRRQRGPRRVAFHGTRAKYQAGCRCAECVLANTLYIAKTRAHDVAFATVDSEAIRHQARQREPLRDYR